jgi:hypothetical protein
MDCNTHQKRFFLADFESNILYQEVYLRLNGINIGVEATPAPCTAGSETVCPVKAGAVNQYSAVVNFSSDLPPVRHNNSSFVSILYGAYQCEKDGQYVATNLLLPY